MVPEIHTLGQKISLPLLLPHWSRGGC